MKMRLCLLADVTSYNYVIIDFLNYSRFPSLRHFLPVLQVFSSDLSVSAQYHSLHLDPGAPPAEQRQRPPGISMVYRDFPKLQNFPNNLNDYEINLFLVQKAGFLGELPSAACSECNGEEPDGLHEGKSGFIFFFFFFGVNGSSQK